jgi:transcription factor C subunit 6
LRCSHDIAKGITNNLQDAFEGIDELEDLRSDDGMNVDAATDTDNDTQDQFQQEEEEVVHSSEEDSDLEAHGSEDGSDVIREAEETTLGELIPVTDDMDDRPIKRRRKRQTGFAKKPPDPNNVYIRGISDHIEVKLSQTNHRLYHFGASNNGHKAIEDAKRKWLYEATLPSRVADANGFGGMHTSFFIGERERANEIKTQGRWWFEDGGMDSFRAAQVLEASDRSSALAYMLHQQSGDASFLMGPFNAPSHFKLGTGQSLSLLQAWQGSSLEHDAFDEPSNYKRGFILNLGAKVHCLDWAPNQHGSNQYLAASVLPERKPSHRPFEAPDAPAFTPQPAHTSNVQVWTFLKSEAGCTNIDLPPKLQLVLCTDWGDVKALKWCPMPFHSEVQPTAKHLGLLAGIWSDGAIRIIEISLPKDDSQTAYVNILKAAFEARPPDTVCTCLAWISSTRIAAGCANGCIAVWDLPSSLQSASSNRRPIIYTWVSSSYILSITTCYPSRPHLLLIASMAGIISMTDLSRFGQSLTSQANTVLGSRARMGLPLLIWHDFGQIAIHAEDNSAIKGSTIRHFFSSITLARAKSNGTSIASSPCHPFILVGCANGDVFVTNPLSRVVDGGKTEPWQQTWFAHEWRRPETQERTNERNGISRFVEGLKAQSVPLTGDGRSGQKHNRHQGTAFTTVYEEESAITAVAWNPNSHVGGWAAAGLSDGLLRVEDISI